MCLSGDLSRALPQPGDRRPRGRLQGPKAAGFAAPMFYERGMACIDLQVGLAWVAQQLGSGQELATLRQKLSPMTCHRRSRLP